MTDTVHPVTLVIRVSEALNDQLVRYCVRTDQSVEAVVARALERFLAHDGD